jgi:hypothetical protein
MPTRRTTRGAERTPLDGEYDVLVCGASFAGLAVARELRGTGARVLVIDRYEIGERQTSACGIPTEWLRAMDLMDAHRQTFGRLVVHTPFGTSVLALPWTFSTFDYPALCELLWTQCDAEFETAKVNGRTGDVVHTDRGDLSAPLVVDALGWRRVLGSGYQPPDAPLSRGLEVHPWGAGDEMELWIDRKYPPTASSSRATPPATASRSPPRESARRSTSASRAGASCAPWSRAIGRSPPPSRATATSPTRTGGGSRSCSPASASSPASRRAC